MSRGWDVPQSADTPPATGVSFVLAEGNPLFPKHALLSVKNAALPASTCQG